MFTEETIFKRITKVARSDIRDFFGIDFKYTDYPTFLDILRSIDPTFFNYKFNDMGSLDFVNRLLRWLEDTREKPSRYPWVKTPSGNLILSQDKKGKAICSFLVLIQGWLNKLISPGNLNKVSPSKPFFIGQKLWDFKNFVGQKRLINGEWNIYLHAANKQDKKLLRGFVSWLVLVKNEPVLYIIYDKEAILSQSDISSVKEWIVCRSRTRRIILHELGHARAELDWYLDHVNTAQQTTWVCSNPLHEYEAWLYALIIRSLIICTRSRITRFLNDVDAEWLSFV